MPGNGKSAKRTTGARSGRPKSVKVMPASGAPPVDALRKPSSELVGVVSTPLAFCELMLQMELVLLVVTFVGFLTVEEAFRSLVLLVETMLLTAMPMASMETVLLTNSMLLLGTALLKVVFLLVDPLLLVETVLPVEGCQWVLCSWCAQRD
ncbi:hypothetical protein PPTG_08073 [Phytophthora nicotianae INRA-310]|uniref:Uncharacterized protein n=1 Tax=Phytophthora nicotianae (strain INRA-310) TaxID=761204 RepID=W2QKS9_PHYN3|nr:hypothetical protein PPTG_08073 [Phytophthora nicotianae INRA-310]ETN13154.1 hypothetical protein PPTG_08073 [Phytophthora nicotianae INRA-310]